MEKENWGGKEAQKRRGRIYYTPRVYTTSPGRGVTQTRLNKEEKEKKVKAERRGWRARARRRIHTSTSKLGLPFKGRGPFSVVGSLLEIDSLFFNAPFDTVLYFRSGAKGAKVSRGEPRAGVEREKDRFRLGSQCFAKEKEEEEERRTRRGRDNNEDNLLILISSEKITGLSAQLTRHPRQEIKPRSRALRSFASFPWLFYHHKVLELCPLVTFAVHLLVFCRR